MTAPRYLIAKYIPDLQRLEPRNVGVIVWSPAGVEARFLAEKTDRPGEVDGRSIPGFVTGASAYRQWIRFWRNEMDKNEIEPISGGEKVNRASPEFLMVLQSANKGNFVLAEGGFLLDPVPKEQLPELAEQLFALLIDTSGVEDSRDPSLEEICERVILEAGLNNDPNFYSEYQLSCRLKNGTEERYQFSHAYQNGSLQRLYQRVPLSRRKTVLRKTIHDSAWMFEKVIEASIICRDQGGAIVYPTEEQQADPEIEQALRVLGSVTRVLNLNDYEAVRNEFVHLRELAIH